MTTRPFHAPDAEIRQKRPSYMPVETATDRKIKRLAAEKRAILFTPAQTIQPAAGRPLLDAGALGPRRGVDRESEQPLSTLFELPRELDIGGLTTLGRMLGLGGKALQAESSFSPFSISRPDQPGVTPRTPAQDPSRIFGVEQAEPVGLRETFSREGFEKLIEASEQQPLANQVLSGLTSPLNLAPGVGFTPLPKMGARTAASGVRAARETIEEAAPAIGRTARELATSEVGAVGKGPKKPLISKTAPPLQQAPEAAPVVKQAETPPSPAPAGVSPPPQATTPPVPPQSPTIPPSSGAPNPPTQPPAGVTPPPQPPQSIGNRHIGPLRDFSDDMAEVKTSDNPIVRFAAGKTGINPSILAADDVGKAVVAYHRQGIEADQLIETALSALDAQAQRFTGSTGKATPINSEGFFAKTGKLWNDVFGRPGDYTLRPETKRYIDTYHEIIDDVERMRVAEGLEPRAKSGDAGWFYVPRQTREIRGVNLNRPSNANLQRLYDEATEGYANGIRYDTDPRATLSLHLRGAMREIIEKRLSSAIEANGLPPSKLIPEPIRIARMDAAKAVQQARREVRDAEFALQGEELQTRIGTKQASAQFNVGLGAQASKAQQRLLAGRASERAKLQADLTAAFTKVDAANKALDIAKRNYTRALEAAQKASVAEGSLFGQQQGTIPIMLWRNRFYPQAQAEQLKKGVDTFGKTNLFEKTVNTIRTSASVFDVAAPFIQGLPVLWRNPVGWGRATWRHYQALLDPTIRARYVQANLATIQEMGRYGIPVTDTEFFAGARAGSGLSLGAPLAKIPKVGEGARRTARSIGKQTYGRFGESYNTFLLSARTELWKAGRTHWQDPAELASWIRNMTGGLDTRALGVGPTQRSVESMFIAFSPRLLRSTVALVADASKLGTQRGRESARTLASLVAGVTGVYIATGIALGKTEEEIMEGLNPLNGKKFLSHNVNGDWIGVGGQVRAITQLVTGIVSAAAPGGEPVGNLIATNRFDNPLINFYSNRGAIGTNIILAGVEATSGGNALPFEDIDNVIDIAKFLGTSAIPFTAQGYLEGEQTATVIAAFTGARTSPPSAAERGQGGSSGSRPIDVQQRIRDARNKARQRSNVQNRIRKARNKARQRTGS